MRELLYSVNQVVVLTKWQKETLEINNIKPKKLHISNHGIDKINILNQKRVEDANNNSISFGYIGRIDYIKGVHVLINSFMNIKAENITLKIHGVANTNDENNYYEYLKNLAINDNRIVFEGPINTNF